jgi:hypothetical protein
VASHGWNSWVAAWSHRRRAQSWESEEEDGESRGALHRELHFESFDVVKKLVESEVKGGKLLIECCCWWCWWCLDDMDNTGNEVDLYIWRKQYNTYYGWSILWDLLTLASSRSRYWGSEAHAMWTPSSGFILWD